MPKALVTYDQNAVRPYLGNIDPFIHWMRTELPVLIAEHLGVPGDPDASLVPSDIEVRFEKVGPDDVFGEYAFGVEIRANDYPVRRRILTDGNQKIRDAIRRHFPLLEDEFFVWTLLGIGAFADRSLTPLHPAPPLIPDAFAPENPQTNEAP